MSKLLALLVVASVVLPMLVGCGSTMTMDPQDHQRMIARNNSLEKKQVVEDWDSFLLQDEPSQLSPWILPDPE